MPTRAFAIVLLIVGLILLGFGLNATESFADTVSEGFTGRYTDKTMWYIIGGSALAVGGLALLIFGGRGATRA